MLQRSSLQPRPVTLLNCPTEADVAGRKACAAHVVPAPNLAVQGRSGTFRAAA